MSVGIVAGKIAFMAREGGQERFTDAAIGKIEVKADQLGRGNQTPRAHMPLERTHSLAQSAIWQIEKISDFTPVMACEHQRSQAFERWGQTGDNLRYFGWFDILRRRSWGLPFGFPDLPASGSAQMHARTIAHHAAQPGRIGRISQIMATRFNGSHQCVLNDIFGIGATGHARGNRQQLSAQLAPWRHEAFCLDCAFAASECSKLASVFDCRGGENR